jgi:putative tricarboxylic transport membrane protein
MGVALVLPFTFSLSPVTAILLLVGTYKGGLYGGSLTAIMINTPGTPSASCTMLDGYPLARQGRALQAMEMALYAAVFGDMVSNASLLILTGWLAKFALAFGSPELFTLILFALTIVASVSGGALTKGLLSAAIGLALATIGTDPIYGGTRFVFGVLDLRAGIHLIPLLIGLFAVPEIFRAYMEPGSGAFSVGGLGTVHTKLKDLRRYWRTLVRGSIIGVILGVIPGLGATPAAFLSYSEARRRSNDPDSFGKGNLEGVTAPEVAANGVAGATMIPLLALGIPGDVITAVILGAFMFNGLEPGPLLFQQHITFIYAIFIGIIFSSLCLLIVGTVSIRGIGRIVNIRRSLLFPVVLVLCVYGSYVVNGSVFDVLIMFMMGLLGTIMSRLQFPLAPLLIAFILGPLLENNLRQSLLISHGSVAILFSSWVCWIFWALTAISIIGVIRSEKKKTSPSPPSSQPQ